LVWGWYVFVCFVGWCVDGIQPVFKVVWCLFYGRPIVYLLVVDDHCGLVVDGGDFYDERLGYCFCLVIHCCRFDVFIDERRGGFVEVVVVLYFL